MKQVYPYPFAAIVGQEEMKLALILNLIHPQLGGVLIRGEKGTAKSTAVRSLVDILDHVDVVADCPFHCRIHGPYCEDCQQKAHLEKGSYKMRVVELPVSATEDRVVGALDMEKAIQAGEKRFEPGILAEANGNLLYVDEVNLLDDHLVDVLLDAAAMGVNTVEREGISYAHPAQFVLVGTMNPEEGDLRPQLLDRFGLVVQVKGEENLQNRKEIIQRRLAFERDPKGFSARWQGENDRIRKRIQQAKENFHRVEISEESITLAAEIGIRLQVDGHRADITLLKAAQSLCAYEGSKVVSSDHVKRSAALVLPHRLRKLPFEKEGQKSMDLEAILNA